MYVLADGVALADGNDVGVVAIVAAGIVHFVPHFGGDEARRKG